MAEFLSLKKNQQVCALQSCCEISLLSAEFIILLLNVDGHILMAHWICVCLLSFRGMRRKLTAVLFPFSLFFFLLLVLKCLVLKDYLFIFLKSVSTWRKLPFYSLCGSLQSWHKFSLFPHVLSPPCMKQSLLRLPTASSASSDERQHAMWLLMEGKTHVHLIIYLATETSFDLREVTFSSSCPTSLCAQWECLMCFYLVGILIQYCSDWRGSEHPEEEENMQGGGRKEIRRKKTQWCHGGETLISQKEHSR